MSTEQTTCENESYTIRRGVEIHICSQNEETAQIKSEFL